MQIFLDSADVGEITELAATGLVDGVTTNPTLIAKSGQDFKKVVEKICGIIPGPVSAEVAATDTATMLKEAAVLKKIARNIVIKIPLTFDGLRACQQLAKDKVKTNVTLNFTANQGLLAMKAGATYLSPFLGRFAQNGGDHAALLADLITIKRNYGFATHILAASIRTADQALLAAKLGADCATIGPAVFRELIKHPMTDDGLAAFIKDWQSTGQKIC
ncbi:MAG: transaldolase family protein [Bdellovibrionales bacterium]